VSGVDHPAMLNDLPLWPERASTFAVNVDYLFLFILVTCAFFAALIFFLVAYLAIRYRRRTPEQRATQIRNSVPLELVWTGVPICLAGVMFLWGAALFMQRTIVPPNAQEIYVVGKQWMWKLQHPEGPREIDELHVPVGRPFRLVMTSEDVIHDFFIPAFRLKQDVLPNRFTSLWFEATKTGQFHLFCSQYCGTNHARMGGWVYVLEPSDYQRWLSGAMGAEPMADSGAKLFTHFGCQSCHQSHDTERGPTLVGLYGKSVQLAGGGTVTGDESYIEESILTPASKVTRGYTPVMPTFLGQIPPDDLVQLIAYIKSLNTPAMARRQP
jgi:cytochrome c oxidase subunit II